MNYSSDQNQDYVFWLGVDPSWLTSDHVVSAFEEEFHPKQEPQFTPNQHLVQPFDPPMDPFPANQFSMLTPVPIDVAPDLGFPSATPPEGPAVDHAEPENNDQFVGWNVEGERLANDRDYEHGLGLYFEEPLIEGLDVKMLDFEHAPVATAAAIAATAEQAETSLNDDMEAPLPESSSAQRDIVSTQDRQRANAARRANPSGNTISCQWNGCRSTFTREHNRAEHMKLHYNRLEYWCDAGACKRRFNTAGLLRSHKFRIHGIRPPQRASSI
ncbi:hypothetical protein K523DRAFT_274058 [Schizophyllum commune Tattone D]|nr:hypothetical protein K523DRAFT_274058 [Schizophyllum commune Tattone D]